MEYRVIEELRDLKQAVDLEISIWGLNPRDAAAVNFMRAISHNGGLTLAAYDGHKMVGIALAFPARLPDHSVVLWSHMTGVHREYQGRNIGFELKCHQREWAIANGYHQICWTFDPLQRGNANFNLHRLGATVHVYHENFYGIMQDEINPGALPSDRVEAHWNIRDPQVAARLAGNFPIQQLEQSSPSIPYLLSDKGEPVLTHLEEPSPLALAQIPPNLTQLANFDNLLVWRLALRDALSNAFASGYRAVDFTKSNAYLLNRE